MLFDAVRGHPELSILAHRMASDEPKIMMPEIGRTLVHREGVQLIREWLASLRRPEPSRTGNSTTHMSLHPFNSHIFNHFPPGPRPRTLPAC